MKPNLRSGLLIGWLLAVVCLSACSPQGSTLTVYVNGWLAEDGDLQVVPRVAGKPGSPFAVSAGTPKFFVTINQWQAGDTVVVDGFERVADGCFIGAGLATTKFQGSGETENLTATLTLVRYKQRQCPIKGCGLSPWCKQPLPTTELPIPSLQGVWADNEDVWAVGYAGAIFHWSGVTGWEVSRKPSQNFYSLDAVWVSKPVGVWAVGFKGTILELDLGLTSNNKEWNDNSIPSPCDNPGDLTTCIKLNAVGRQTNTWVAGSSPTDQKNLFILNTTPYTPFRYDFEIRSIWMTPSRTWISGTGGKIGFVDNNGLNPSDLTPKPLLPTLHGIWEDGAGTFSTVGEGGHVCSGNTQAVASCVQLRSAETLLSVTGNASLKQVWAVGQSGRIWIKEDTQDWLPSYSGTATNINSVFETPNGTVWAVGDNGTVLLYN